MNYASNLKINVKHEPTPKSAFSTEEIEKLWAYQHDGGIKLILMRIYSGVRVSELLNLKKEDVHFQEQYFYVRESKTDSGVRVVPIADKVFPFWKYYLNKNDCPSAFCTAEV